MVNLWALHHCAERPCLGIVENDDASQELDAGHTTAQDVNGESTVTTLDRASLLRPKIDPLVELEGLSRVSELLEILEDDIGVDRVRVTQVEDELFRLSLIRKVDNGSCDKVNRSHLSSPALDIWPVAKLDRLDE